MTGSQPTTSNPPVRVAVPLTALDVDRSCRVPLLILFTSAAVWLFIGSCFGLIASIKFHSPTFLAGSAWLTYGRVRPVYTNALLYGFALQTGLALALWLFAQLGNARLGRGLLVIFGAVFLNLGVTAGLAGILMGDSTGFETLEIPGYAAPLVFAGCLLIVISGVLTFHGRSRQPLYASQWFLLAAIFWFPWIYCTAELLLVSFPVRGMAQAAVAWWYSQNFTDVWLSLIGLAATWYLVPILSGKTLRSHYLALFAFWLLILFVSWSGIPGSAPLPAWMPSLSSASKFVSLALFVAVALNVYGSVGRFALVSRSDPRLSFVLFGMAAFLLSGLMNIAEAFRDPGQLLAFSWFTPARALLQIYGFFVMVCFGAIYYVLPRLLEGTLVWPKLVGLHFWFGAAGVVLTTLPFAVAGIVQAAKMQNASIPFVDIARATLPFLRVSTVGDLLLVAGNLLLLVNIMGSVVRLVRAHLSRTYEVATEDLFKPSEARG